MRHFLGTCWQLGLPAVLAAVAVHSWISKAVAPVRATLQPGQKLEIPKISGTCPTRGSGVDALAAHACVQDSDVCRVMACVVYSSSAEKAPQLEPRGLTDTRTLPANM